MWSVYGRVMLASGVCNIWLGCKFCVELLGFLINLILIRLFVFMELY